MSKLYHQLIDWYRLLDPLEDHKEEVDAYAAAIKKKLEGSSDSLLELGAGAGNNGYYLKQHFNCTLSDLSEEMLNLSRKINPECEHVCGDMRTLRLNRTFDTVLAHDAIVYMTTEDDLRKAIENAYIHLRPGGVAIFAPDMIGDSFPEHTELHRKDLGTRSMRCIEWMWDPDPSDTSYRIDFSFLLRHKDQVKAVYDCHEAGIFTQQTWFRLLEESGFEAEYIELSMEEGVPYPFSEGMFICKRR